MPTPHWGCYVPQHGLGGRRGCCKLEKSENQCAGWWSLTYQNRALHSWQLGQRNKMCCMTVLRNINKGMRSGISRLRNRRAVGRKAGMGARLFRGVLYGHLREGGAVRGMMIVGGEETEMTGGEETSRKDSDGDLDQYRDVDTRVRVQDYDDHAEMGRTGLARLNMVPILRPLGIANLGHVSESGPLFGILCTMWSELESITTTQMGRHIRSSPFENTDRPSLAFSTSIIYYVSLKAHQSWQTHPRVQG